MKTLHFNSFKIASTFPLDRISHFFRLQRPLSWRDHLLLEDSQLELALKYHTTGKKVYIFQFGCITFINFNEGETRNFLNFFESIAGKISYDMFARFHEYHTFGIYDDGSCMLWENGPVVPYHAEIISVMATILAKSAALYKVETDISSLLDKIEIFIHYLNKGKLYANSKTFAAITSKLLRFEYDSINNIRIFDRASATEQNLMLRNTYDKLSVYYELNDRFDIIENKVKDLLHITAAYSNLSNKHLENRQNLFVAILLALFPLSYGIEFIIHTYGSIEGFLQQFM